MPDGPCWTPLHTHHSAQDLAEWNAYSAATRAAADAAGALVLWTATGRQFSECPVVGRPVQCPQLVSDAEVATAPFYPVDLGSGDWINLVSRCDCNIDDLTRVKLVGPVVAITSVTIDGVVFAAANYRLDGGNTLTRTDGGYWPLWQNVSLANDTAGTFVVRYTFGTAAPDALKYAAGDYALEWARATAPASSTLCRLPSRAKEIVRQGVTMTLVDPAELLRGGLTGIPTIDGIIRALNPHKLVAQPRVLVPYGTAELVG